ncbi:MAG: ISAs1 family transposase [bacterium]|nr:ISAs1 family transposase [bacterium]
MLATRCSSRTTIQQIPFQPRAGRARGGRGEVASYFASEIGDSLVKSDATYSETTDGDHGRIEIRRYWLTTDIDWFEDADDWPGLQAFGMVEAERTVGDAETTVHRRYYLTTLEDVGALARAVRSHWGVENSLHWVLDMAFDEDHSRVRSGHAAENFAIVRQVALNLLKQEKAEKVGIKTKRKMCGWDHNYLLTVLGLRRPTD